MSDLGKLLRNSRFASLAKPLKQGRNKTHPTHQVVETRKAALHRQEWGLKYALPSKVESRYITFNNFDNLERFVDFETNGGDHWKRLRFQQTGLVPQLSKNATKQNPLFNTVKSEYGHQTELGKFFNLDGSSAKRDVKSVAYLLKDLRDEFKEWLLKTAPKKLKGKGFNVHDFETEAYQFLSEYQKKQSVNTIESLRSSSNLKVHAYGGLSYKLKGKLINEPNGIVDKNVVPGRFLNNASKQTTPVAIGGFVAEVANAKSQIEAVQNNGVPRETVVPFEPREALIEDDGAVTVKANVVNLLRSRPRFSNIRKSQSQNEPSINDLFNGYLRK